jgi:hypothetical protein
MSVIPSEVEESLIVCGPTVTKKTIIRDVSSALDMTILRFVQFRQLAPEFAFFVIQFFRDVDLDDNVEITAFP